MSLRCERVTSLARTEGTSTRPKALHRPPADELRRLDLPSRNAQHRQPTGHSKHRTARLLPDSTDTRRDIGAATMRTRKLQRPSPGKRKHAAQLVMMGGPRAPKASAQPGCLPPGPRSSHPRATAAPSPQHPLELLVLAGRDSPRLDAYFRRRGGRGAPHDAGGLSIAACTGRVPGNPIHCHRLPECRARRSRPTRPSSSPDCARSSPNEASQTRPKRPYNGTPGVHGSLEPPCARSKLPSSHTSRRR